MIYFEDLWDLIHNIAVPLEVVDCFGKELAYYSNADDILQDFHFFEGCLVDSISAYSHKFIITLDVDGKEFNLPWIK